jgi:hypothetical protein
MRKGRRQRPLWSRLKILKFKLNRISSSLVGEQL